jgi:hypothetical protein
MRKLFPFVVFFVSSAAAAQKHEVGLTLGELFSQDRGTVPNVVRLNSGIALQANYGHHFIGRPTALTLLDGRQSFQDARARRPGPGFL